MWRKRGINSRGRAGHDRPDRAQTAGTHPDRLVSHGACHLSADGRTLYVINAKGVGEDINPATVNAGHNPTGVESFTDSNYIFGTAQKIDLSSLTLDNTTVLNNNFAVQNSLDTSIVPVGGAASAKIKHVFFILQENKTFDCFLGNQNATSARMPAHLQ